MVAFNYDKFYSRQDQAKMGSAVEHAVKSSHVTGNKQKQAEVVIPGYIGRSLTSVLIFIMGATMRGM